MLQCKLIWHTWNFIRENCCYYVTFKFSSISLLKFYYYKWNINHVNVEYKVNKQSCTIVSIREMICCLYVIQKDCQYPIRGKCYAQTCTLPVPSIDLTEKTSNNWFDFEVRIYSSTICDLYTNVHTNIPIKMRIASWHCSSERVSPGFQVNSIFVTLFTPLRVKKLKPLEYYVHKW